MATMTIPELALVVLVGPSGAGKSTFARTHFKPTEVLSSDFCRGLVSNDENAMDATADAFDVLRYIAAKRLARGLLTVIDATNVQPESRKPLVELAREHDVLPAAIVLNLPEALCQERNRSRPDRNFGPHVIRNQAMQLRRGLKGLQREGFRSVAVLRSPEEVAAATVERQPLWNDRRDDHGPFDIIGDVHGCFDELAELLLRLGYRIEEAPSDPFGVRVTPAPGRKAVFLGDLVDRGPKVPQVLRLVMSMVQAGAALCVPGNHDVKLLRKLSGRDVQITHGLAESLAQLATEPPEFSQSVARFIDALVSHYVLDDGSLVVAHAGMKERFAGRASKRVREFALYGETTGETDEFGLPVRYNWAADYRGPACVVYGHTPVPQAEWLNRTINIDTGCVFGGSLSALRYPELEVISVPARAAYAVAVRPAAGAAEIGLSSQQQHDDLLDIDDVRGKRIVYTRLHATITVREENATAALEVMSRFAADPKWLIYLPPTMSPTETSRLPGLLEHPAEAFDHFRAQGVRRVVCQEKHMGSRAVVVICRDEQTASRRFGVREDRRGIVYTRTGRGFFADKAVESAVLDRLAASMTATGLWDELASDWFCLDCELMPWSAKAQELLRQQYAAVGSAAGAALNEADVILATATGQYPEGEAAAAIRSLRERCRERREQATKFVEAYGRYCWPVRSIDDLRLAPFHLLAGEGNVYTCRDHLWHMHILARLATSPTLMATRHLELDLADPSACDRGIAWWEDLTARGGEGMVVKPLDFIVRGPRGLVQPAIKCRGSEYLRIIYGPEYDTLQNIDRLRRRGLSAKRSLAIREFALGVESLERFVRREPLRRVHECVFAVLALESEPVDPRL